MRGDRRSNRCAVACRHADHLPGQHITERIGDLHPQCVRHCAVSHGVILRHLQTRDLRRPDIGDKCHVPAQAAVVDGCSDCTDPRRLAGDTALHRPVWPCDDRRGSRCAVASQHAHRLPGKRITERIGDLHPQRVRRRTVRL